MSVADQERWDTKWAAHEPDSVASPADALVALAEYLPNRGTALDVAAGRGRHGIWLAQRGLDVTALDISPVGLSLAAAAAERAGVRLATQVHDLDADLPPGRVDLIVVHHFLDRALIRGAPAHLTPGGVFVMVHPTRTNLERHPRPSARFLLEPGELQSLALAAGLAVRYFAEGWTSEGRHEARLVAAAS